MSTFELTTIAPVSKKNNPKILHRGSKRRCRHCRSLIGGYRSVSMSDQARADTDEIAWDAMQKVHSTDRPLFPDEDVSVTILVNPRTKRMRLRIEAMGPKPKGYTGRKRDTHSHIDVAMDALQGIVFTNDSQVKRLIIQRVIEEVA
jgi:hypothetical protein